jgi:hypothetical protein
MEVESLSYGRAPWLDQVFGKKPKRTTTKENKIFASSYQLKLPKSTRSLSYKQGILHFAKLINNTSTATQEESRSTA